MSGPSPTAARRRPPLRRVLPRYLLFQIPGWAAAGTGLALAVEWWGLAPHWALLGFAAWLVKDAALFPVLRDAYEPDADGTAHGPVDAEGVADTRIDGEGWIQVGPERWRARTRPDAAPIPRGARVRVLAVRGHELLVEAIDA